ncbi:MAG: H-NS histone family protein [Pseudomonadota bacterium]
MSVDLSNVTLSELRKLEKNVQKAINTAEARQRKDARAAVEKVAKEYGVPLSELIAEEKAQPKGRKKPTAKKVGGKPKFRNPADPTQTWTGKGRRPQWYVEAIKAGQAEADLLV